MKRHTPFLILLCIALLACLLGCDNDAVETTAPTDPTVVPTTTVPVETEPPIDPYALYEEAAAATPADITMALFIDRQIQVADLVLTASTQQNITYLGQGTEDFRARVTDNSMFGDYNMSSSETYADGMLYAMLHSEYFREEITPEEYTAQYAPAVLLDSSLYETLEYDENGTFTFSGATGLERWVLDEEVEIIDAGGTAIVANGVIMEATYNVTYMIGGTQITLSVEQLLSTPDNITISAPAVPDNYALVEDFHPVKVVDQAYGYLMAANTMQMQATQTIVSSFDKISVVHTYEVGMYDISSDPLFMLNESLLAVDLSSGAQHGLTYEGTFQNNVYSYSENGGRSTPNRSVSRSMIRSACQQTFADQFPEHQYIADAMGIDLGGIYVAVITGTEELGQIICQGTTLTIHGELDALDKKASDYRNDTVEHHIAIDKYTGLPISMGMNYAGTHTIWGREYALTQESSYSFDLAAFDVYESITGEPAPETEPEEKATPLFYHVTGPEGQEMWLLGTIHVGDVRTGFLPQEIYDAFIASDALAIECNTEAFLAQLEEDAKLSETVAGHYYYTDGTTAADHVSDEQLYNDALTIMKALGRYNTTLTVMKPALWSQEIANAYLALGNKLTAGKGVESRLLKLAEEYGKPILEVESALSQIEMMTGYSDPVQEFLLAASVYSPLWDTWNATHELYDLWCQGDEAALIEALKEDISGMTEEELALYNEYYNALNLDRNDGMLEVAIGYLESGDTVFYAVGLAHLLADNGLVFALRDAGYTVELVAYVTP